MAVKCAIHHVNLVLFCPACRGAMTSPRKAKASRKNGLKGGRPRRTKKPS